MFDRVTSYSVDVASVPFSQNLSLTALVLVGQLEA